MLRRAQVGWVQRFVIVAMFLLICAPVVAKYLCRASDIGRPSTILTTLRPLLPQVPLPRRPLAPLRDLQLRSREIPSTRDLLFPHMVPFLRPGPARERPSAAALRRISISTPIGAHSTICTISNADDEEASQCVYVWGVYGLIPSVCVQRSAASRRSAGGGRLRSRFATAASRVSSAFK